MARRPAVGDGAKRVSQNTKIQHLPLDLVGFGMQFRPRKLEGVVLSKHSSNVFERKPGSLPQPDQ